jgi:hypothetical protein
MGACENAMSFGLTTSQSITHIMTGRTTFAAIPCFPSRLQLRIAVGILPNIVVEIKERTA